MKKVCLILILSLIVVNLCITAQDYYWYKGNKIYYDQIAQKMINMPSLSSIRSIPSDWNEYIVTNRFLVKLKNASDLSLLTQYAFVNNIQSITSSSLPLWYILSCPECTTNNVLSLVNSFYESSLFAAVEPEFKNLIFHTCVNDTIFYRQWYLENTGQNGDENSGLDINYCDAHSITSGNSDIKIALIDVGVDSTHEDIPPISFRYDVLSMISQDSLYNGYLSYGTAAASIIAANTNNITGIAGIAPNCSLMSISIPEDSRTTSVLLADAISYAVNHDADVINFPWIMLTYSEYIYDALDNAHINGRNGKGCVVVFGAGNTNGAVMFPAETHEENIVVGALSKCGTRKSQVSCFGYDGWGSCFGDRLDVVAPGEGIAAGDNDSIYTMGFCGTSASCAQVSAIAGLILSINQNLTAEDVGKIINSTARKIGPYSYDSIAPDGNWNFEMGYGLVDAYAAIIKNQLSSIEIEGPTYLCSTPTKYNVKNAPENSTIHWSLSNFVTFHRIIYGASFDTVTIGTIKDMMKFSTNGDGEYLMGGHISPPIFPVPDSATLSVTVAKDGMSFTKVKWIYGANRGEPEFTCSDTSTYWQRYAPRTFSVTNCNEVQDDNLRWEIRIVSPDYGTMWPWTYSGRTITFVPIYVGTYEVTLENHEKDCNINTMTKTYHIGYNMPAKSIKKTSTSVEDISHNEQPKSTKLLRDGQMYIIHENKEYNANGVRIR